MNVVGYRIFGSGGIGIFLMVAPSNIVPVHNQGGPPGSFETTVNAIRNRGQLLVQLMLNHAITCHTAGTTIFSPDPKKPGHRITVTDTWLRKNGYITLIEAESDPDFLSLFDRLKEQMRTLKVGREEEHESAMRREATDFFKEQIGHIQARYTIDIETVRRVMNDACDEMMISEVLQS